MKLLPIAGFAAFLALMALWVLPALAQKNVAAPPVVVELYTSQGCSSCPPADALFAEIAHRDGVIALGCHVTYWDRIGWEDTLGRAACDDRQNDYVRALKENTVFTPQMIVNGTHSFIGSRKNEAAKALRAAASAPISRINLKQESGTLTIMLPQAGKPLSAPADILLVLTSQTRTQVITRGENKGRDIEYINPVRSIRRIGSWNGTAQTMTETLEFRERGRAAVIAQEPGNKAVIAAGSVLLYNK